MHFSILLRKMMVKRWNIEIVILLVLSFVEVQLNFVQFNDQFIKKVYTQSTSHLFIYVYDQPTLETQSIFMQFCHKQQRVCAILDESIKDYDKLIQFIGYKSKQYFLILDGPNNKKFILNANQVKSIASLQNFASKVQNHQWQAYYASEQPKNDRYMPCRSIAGTQVKHFLEEPGMKVIYLYRDTKKCPVCGQMLRYYADTAQNFYKQNIVSFAYINVHLNDHPLIKTKKTPSFLVFESASQLPESFSGEQYQKMELKIQQLIQKYTGEVRSLTRHEYTKFLSDLEDI